jgi:hypothetical protein
MISSVEVETRQEAYNLNQKKKLPELKHKPVFVAHKFVLAPNNATKLLEHENTYNSSPLFQNFSF